MKTRLAQLLRLSLSALVCVALALVLAWEAFAIGYREDVAAVRDTKDLVKVGVATAPVAAPLLLHLRTLLNNR